MLALLVIGFSNLSASLEWGQFGYFPFLEKSRKDIMRLRTRQDQGVSGGVGALRERFLTGVPT